MEIDLHLHMMGFRLWVQFRAGCVNTPASLQYLFDGINSVTSSYIVSHHHTWRHIIIHSVTPASLQYLFDGSAEHH